jgi:hypothetical protein
MLGHAELVEEVSAGDSKFIKVSVLWQLGHGPCPKGGSVRRSCDEMGACVPDIGLVVGDWRHSQVEHCQRCGTRLQQAGTGRSRALHSRCPLRHSLLGQEEVCLDFCMIHSVVCDWLPFVALSFAD